MVFFDNECVKIYVIKGIEYFDQTCLCMLLKNLKSPKYIRTFGSYLLINIFFYSVIKRNNMFQVENNVVKIPNIYWVKIIN